jgi:hypothetical protein
MPPGSSSPKVMARRGSPDAEKEIAATDVAKAMSVKKERKESVRRAFSLLSAGPI